jgi:hypothetical protein
MKEDLKAIGKKFIPMASTIDEKQQKLLQLNI